MLFNPLIQVIIRNNFLFLFGQLIGFIEKREDNVFRDIDAMFVSIVFILDETLERRVNLRIIEGRQLFWRGGGFGE